MIQKGVLKCMRKGDGMYYLKATRMKPDVDAANTIEEVKKIDINEAHDKMGHIGEVLIRKTLENHGIEVIGSMKSCEGCGLAMAKQKKISKITKTRAEKKGERIFVDLSGPYPTTLGGTNYQVHVVDDFTRIGFVGFLKTKDKLKEWLKEKILKVFKSSRNPVKFIRMDNAGENKKAVEE